MWPSLTVVFMRSSWCSGGDQWGGLKPDPQTLQGHKSYKQAVNDTATETSSSRSLMHTSLPFLFELTSFVQAVALKLQLPIFPTADCGGGLLKSLKQVLHMLEEQIGDANV